MQIYVFCCAHAEQVVEHLGNAGWLSHLHCHVQVTPLKQYTFALAPVRSQYIEDTCMLRADSWRTCIASVSVI